jgi:ATP-binding cassette subfamily B protein
VGSTTRAALIGSAFSVAGWLLFAVGFIGGILLVVVKAAHRDIAIGEVVLAVSLLRRAQMQVSQTANLAGQLATIARTARRFQWLEDFAQGAPSGPHAVSLSATRFPDRPITRLGDASEPHRHQSVGSALRSGIALQQIGFCYPGTDTAILRGVDILLPAGSTVALVGENGAGKTTLVKLLCLMYTPDSGSILVDGVDLNDVGVDEWRSRISATFQDFVQYQLRAGQTVGVGDLPRIDDQAAVVAALERAQATNVIGGLSEGLATRLGRSFTDGQDLSGGQWQKLALGRGMMLEQPLLVVLDEPTASLDAPTEHAIFEQSMQRARQAAAEAGTITLLVSHRFSTVRMADLIIVLEHGRVLESGSHPDLVRQGGKYAELFELQARSYR